MSKKVSCKVVSIALLVFILLGVFFSCNSETELMILEEGLYYDGFSGPIVRFIEVDEYGDAYTFYEDYSDCCFPGFAYHDGKATSYFQSLEIGDSSQVKKYMVEATKPVELLPRGDGFYFIDPGAFKDWTLVYEECDKYLFDITLEADCEKGIISLTGEEEAFPYMVKSIRIIPPPFREDICSSLVEVVDKELHLISKNNLNNGFSFDIEVTIATGIAEERLGLTINLVGCDDRP